MPDFVEALLRECSKLSLQVAAMACFVEHTRLSKMKKADIVINLLQCISEIPGDRTKAGTAVLDTMKKNDIQRFLCGQGVSGVWKLRRDQLVAITLGGPVPARVPETSPPACAASACDVIVEAAPVQSKRARLGRKWSRMARKMNKFEKRKAASDVIKRVIKRQMHMTDPSQTVGDLWGVVVCEVSDAVSSESTSLRQFFHAQVMKFFRLHVFQKGKGWKKRRRAKPKNFCGDTQMMQHLDREGMAREDWMSNGL